MSKKAKIDLGEAVLRGTERAKGNILRPTVALPPPPVQKREVKNFGVSLYGDELAWLDHLERRVRRAGKGNRSFVLRQALRALRRELEGKTPEEITAWFKNQYLKELQQEDILPPPPAF